MSQCPAGTACDANCPWVEITDFSDAQHRWLNAETGEERRTSSISHATPKSEGRDE